MAYKIKEIQLAEDAFGDYQIDSENKTKVLKNLSKINIFVGANNSGKSRFLRSLFIGSKNLNEVEGMISPQINEQIQHTVMDINKWESELKEKQTNLSSQQRDQIRQFNQGKLKFIKDIKTNFKSNSRFPIIDVYNDFLKWKAEVDDFNKNGHYNKIEVEINDLKNLYEKNTREFYRLFSTLLFYRTGRLQIYIPTLRGLRPVQAYNNQILDKDHKEQRPNNYLIRTKSDYQFKNDNEIFTGLNLYSRIRDLLLGKKEDREKVANFEKFLSEHFFENKPVTLIPNKDDDVLYIGIGDDPEFPIYDLGDGIQQIIILTFPLFENTDKDLLVFIEEPELYLHPGMQRTFLDVISTYPKFDNHQFFIATHSNHFLDITLEMDKISVYTFRKKSKDGEDKTQFLIENVTNDDCRSLNELGVRNSSVFLSNCTIWVEGITDRLYLRKYFEIYQKSLPKDKQRFKEDLHYSFVEYGGSNITHFNFSKSKNNENTPVDRISQRVFLVADNYVRKENSENEENNTKETRHTELLKQLGENRYHQLKGLEIENLLIPKILNKIIAEYEKCNPSDVKFKNTNEIKHEDYYENIYLGEFIEENLDNKKRSGSYKKGRTISDKVNFCRKALKYIETTDDMCQETKELCKKMYDFIAENNKTI